MRLARNAQPQRRQRKACSRRDRELWPPALYDRQHWTRKPPHTVTVSVRGLTRPVLPIVQGRGPQFSIATTAGLALPPLGLCIPREAHALSSEQVQIGRAS